MNFDLIDPGKPGGEELMGHNVWICFQTARESARLEDLLGTLQQEAQTSIPLQQDLNRRMTKTTVCAGAVIVRTQCWTKWTLLNNTAIHLPLRTWNSLRQANLMAFVACW